MGLRIDWTSPPVRTTNIDEIHPLLEPVGVVKLFVFNSGRVIEVALDTPTVLGRASEKSTTQPDLDFGPDGAAENGVSRRHARLLMRGGYCLIEDLGSVNGTFLKGQRLPAESSAPLQTGDEIRLGTLILRIELR
jgi:pSer/pThr/pTyr-binding forkhead associated (FHA) protein